MEKLKIVYKAIDDKMGLDIKIIDFRNFSPLFDYFVIASAASFRNAKAIVENVIDEISKEYSDDLKVEYTNDSKWLLVRMQDIVVHIFVGDERQNYNLEKLWKDLPLIETEEWR